jgi:hypothetical protein
MPHGQYKKMLVRLPLDIVDWLQAEAVEQDRSITGQLVHILRTQAPPRKDRDADRQRRPTAPVS